MKTVIKKSRIILLAVCVLFSVQTPAYAQNATTEAQVAFTAGEGPTFPVDPDNPGMNESGAQSVRGSLAIVSVSDFQFGTIPVRSAAALYDITTGRPNLQVVDLRGSGTGWNVSAAVSRFTSGGSESLPGASILISNGRPNSLSNSPAPVQTQNLRLTTDGVSAAVVTAADGAGTGLWVMRGYPATGTAYIQLDVPAGSATVGNHTATISWTLQDTPS